MGQWNISIHGTGVHHNKNLPADANRMAAKFVRELKAAGHSISHATITYGGEENVTNVSEEEDAARHPDPKEG